jgi:hypothetical protein
LKEGKQYGGDGGAHFDNACDLGVITKGEDRHRCVSIDLHLDRGSDSKLTSICFNYGKISDKHNHIGKHRGRDRDKVDTLDLNQGTFVLKSNDAIEKITVYVGRRQRFHWEPRTIPIVTAVQFYTVKRVVSNVFGTTANTEEMTEHFPAYTFA